MLDKIELMRWAARFDVRPEAIMIALGGTGSAATDLPRRLAATRTSSIEITVEDCRPTPQIMDDPASLVARLVAEARKNSENDEQFARRIAEACAVLADRTRDRSIVGDAGAAIRSVFQPITKRP